MASDRWSFDSRVNRYRDEVTGRFLGRSQVVSLRDRALDAASEQARDLAGRAARGEITIDQFRDGMRQVIRRTETAQYVFGRGGRSAMTRSDYGRLGALVKKQYRALDGFIRDMQFGTLSEKQAQARAALYGSAGVEANGVAESAAWGVRMPAVPGSDCLGGANCRCWLTYERTEAGVEVTWHTEANPCAVCARHGSEWNPLVFSREELAA